MKTNRIIASLVAAGLLTVGACSDEFLEVAPANSLGDAQLQTKDGVEGLLIGAYAALNGVFGNRFEGPNHWVTGSILGIARRSPHSKPCIAWSSPVFDKPSC